jgi:hypothetical protein
MRQEFFDPFEGIGIEIERKSKGWRILSLPPLDVKKGLLLI